MKIQILGEFFLGFSRNTDFNMRTSNRTNRDSAKAFRAFTLFQFAITCSVLGITRITFSSNHAIVFSVVCCVYIALGRQF